MTKIIFILWFTLWPLACTLDSYLNAKRREITKEEHLHPDAREKMNAITTIVWLFGMLLILLTPNS